MDWSTITAAELLAMMDGAMGSEWMAIRIQADQAGRLDLMQLAIDQATEAYLWEEENQ
jgi:hypothetical protein